ncbi:transcription factor GTE4-like protein [Tanacetum coccineum]
MRYRVSKKESWNGGKWLNVSYELVWYVQSGCTTTLNVVPWETDGESVLREAVCGSVKWEIELMKEEVVIDADKINKQKSTCVNLVYTRRPKKPKTTTPVEPVVTPGIEPIINNDPSSSGQSQPHENGVPLLKEQQQGPLVSLLDDRVKICLKSSTPKPEINNLKGNLEQELEQVRILYRRFEEKENEIEMTRQHQQAQQTVVVVDPAPVVHNHNLDHVYQRQQEAQQSPTLLHYHTPPVTTFNRRCLSRKDRLPPESNKRPKPTTGLERHKIQVFRSCSTLLQSVPLEVGTIKSRLAQNFYKVPTEFAEDVRLTFNNAMSYNPKGHEVYVMAEQLLNIFEDTKGSQSTVLPRPATIVPFRRTHVPKKSKAREPNKRDMTYEEKQKLSLNLQNLSSNHRDGVVQIIKKNNTLSQNDEEKLILIVLILNRYGNLIGMLQIIGRILVRLEGDQKPDKQEH